MAKIVINIEDATGPKGDAGINVEIESSDPPMPVKDGTLDFDKATPSQNLAFGAVMEIAGLAAANELIVERR